jgi:hypothetical protein
MRGSGREPQDSASLDLKCRLNGATTSDHHCEPLLCIPSGLSAASKILASQLDTHCEHFLDLGKQIQQPNSRLDFRIPNTTIRVIVVRLHQTSVTPP